MCYQKEVTSSACSDPKHLLGQAAWYKNKIYFGVDKNMFDLRLQVVIYPEREWSDWESSPQQRWLSLLFCGLNTYRLQSCAFMDNPLHESPRHFISSKEWTARNAVLRQKRRTGHKVASWNLLCSVALDASFSCNLTQTILGRRHFGIRCMLGGNPTME